MNVRFVKTKSIITKSNLPDADYVINPYIGCQHACIYCYADFMKRFTGHINEEWGSFVDIKMNSADTIKLKTFQGKTILIGSVTDPYQQFEATYKITQSILERLLEFQPKIEVLTKSGLVQRDISIFQKFENLKIGVSLNTLDSKISHLLEPHASSPKKRIETLKKLHDCGIKTYLFISPIFPYITDYKLLLEETKGFVDEYLFENLNIRANNRLRIRSFIEEFYPELSLFYNDMPQHDIYFSKLENEISSFCLNKNISFKIYFRHNSIKGGDVKID